MGEWPEGWFRDGDAGQPPGPSRPAGAGDPTVRVPRPGLNRLPDGQASASGYGPGGRDYTSFDELVDVTRRRLCLPPGRAAEVAEALVESGVDPEHPVDLGSSGREVVTIWWDGTAG